MYLKLWNLNLQSTVFEFWPRMRNRELYIDQITKFHLFKLSFCTLFWWCTKNSGRPQARILQTEIGYLIFWVFFFVESDILHRTALSLVNSNATCRLRRETTNPILKTLPLWIYVYRFCIDNFVSNKYVEKMEIYIKLDIHLQFRLLILGRTLFNILIKIIDQHIHSCCHYNDNIQYMYM